MFPTDCVRMCGFHKRVLDFVQHGGLRWISTISFRSIDVDFIAENGFRLIGTGYRKFWWISIFRPTELQVSNFTFTVRVRARNDSLKVYHLSVLL